MPSRRIAVVVVVGVACSLAPALPARAAADTCFGRTPTITGTKGKDRLRGTPGDDVIFAGAGNDRVTGRGGDDRICAGKGADVVGAGRGSDLVDGGEWDDTLRGNGGDDRLHLGTVGRSLELAYGGSGADILVAASDSYALMFGERGPDRLVAADSLDMLDGGRGDDRIEGGTASFETSEGPVAVDLAAGTATGHGDDVLAEVAAVNGSVYGDTIEGSPGADVIMGARGDDELSGGGGADAIYGGPDEDALAGGEGDDVLFDVSDDCSLGRGCERDGAADDFDGGPGRDRVSYFGSEEGVTVDLAEGSGPGSDAIAAVEDLSGTSHDDVLLGDDGPNDVNGGHGGVDRIEGRGGDDVLDGGPESDTVDGGEGTDRCIDAEAMTDCEE